MKRLVLLLFCAVMLLPAAVYAETASAEQLTVSGADKKLTDANHLTYTECETLNIKADNKIGSLYIIFFDTPTDFTVESGGKSKAVSAEFLHTLADISDIGSGEVTVKFNKSVRVCDIYAFTAGTLPDFVQTWKKPCERADIMLVSSHADDEQLFFAGLLPLYASRGCDVQVVYYTDHKNEPRRRHELLNGLWTVGITNYPVISSFPDYYSETADGALKTIAGEGYTQNDALAFQVEMLRRFKPQVAVSHDLNGEYGHGMHKLNAAMLTKAVEISGDSGQFADSAERYGVHTVKKLYVHLYEKNKIVMNYDEASDYFGGKTPFQMSQQGFLCHASQQGTWFKKWIFGKNGEITKASQITKYSPCNYGLYFTAVGEDTLKNDMLENITTYKEQQRLEEEKEKARLEEEQRLKKEKEAKEKAAAQNRARLKRQRTRRIIAAVILTPVIVLTAVYAAINIAARQRAKKRRKRKQGL